MAATPRRELPVGEKLTYDVSWMGIPVGVGEVEIYEKVREGSREIYRVRAIAKTNEVLSKLYPVEDRVESDFDAEDFHSVRFRKKLSEGRYRADEETVFDPAAGKGHYKSLLNGEKKEFSAASGVMDIVSAFYAFRTRAVKPGGKVDLKVSSEESDWNVEIDVLSLEHKEMKQGAVDVLVTEPKTRLKGILYRRGRVWIHFSADEKRVPILIQFKTPFGPIVGVLRGFDTL